MPKQKLTPTRKTNSRKPKKLTTLKCRSQHGGTIHINRTPEGLHITFVEIGKKSGLFSGGIEKDLQQIETILKGTDYTTYEKQLIKHKLALLVYPDSGILTPTEDRMQLRQPVADTIKSAIKKFVDKHCPFPEFESYGVTDTGLPIMKYINYQQEPVHTDMPDYNKYDNIIDLPGCILPKDYIDDVLFSQCGLHLDDLVESEHSKRPVGLQPDIPKMFCLLYDCSQKRYIICEATLTNSDKVSELRMVFPPGRENEPIFYNIGKPPRMERRDAMDYVFSASGTAFQVSILYGAQIKKQDYNYWLTKSKRDSDAAYIARTHAQRARRASSPPGARPMTPPTARRVSPHGARPMTPPGARRASPKQKEGPPPYTPGNIRSLSPPPAYAPAVPSAPPPSPPSSSSNSEIDLR